MYIGSDKNLNALAKARASIGTKTCPWCNDEIHASGYKKHEKYCYHRPERLHKCPVCEEVVKSDAVTCSHACSNTLFRSGENHPNWSEDAYRTTCFTHHEKKCVVCGEENIVEVHHLDEDKTNNNPSNLIPLCPTHHQYWHSRFKSQVEGAILRYAQGFVLGGYT
ncbi:HNH endonuclease [Mesorhizobium sp. M00.F.Ca.ET.217.01.1.1]|uniref:HNH endonuclease n=1 Tax=Mesorhizobium sp. M00.F.Ca.ET.217.01.1.1 TaxID=2500529 RepID=UPI0016779FEA